MKAPRAAALAAAWLLALSACRSEPRPALDQPLPFHVLLVEPTAAIGPVTLPPGARATSMRLAPDPELAAKLAAELQSVGFARVSRAAPGGDPLREARQRRADLILTSELYGDPNLWRRRSASTAVSWLLFALGGPFVTNLEDWEYGSGLRLKAELYEVARLEAGVPLGDPRARLAQLDGEFAPSALSFNQRRAGSTPYWKALLIPSHLLATESEALEGRLSAELAPRLARGLEQRLGAADEALFAARPGGSLAVDGQAFGLERRERGWRLSGRARLAAGSAQGAPRGVRVWSGERAQEGRFGAPESGPAGPEFPFEVLFEAAGQRFVRLEIEAGERDLERHSFCFDLERPGAVRRGG